jgi:peptidoglycan/xylan/chitin deacetylase (PgdA/CDA1 family)
MGILGKIAKGVGVSRGDVAGARMYCERHALATVGRRRRRRHGRILCYHSVGQPEMGVNDVTPAQFRGHIELALADGYSFVPASAIARAGGGPQDLAITFDDGLGSVLSVAAPILRDLDVPWSFFPVSSWCDHYQDWRPGAMLSWRGVEEVVALGGEVGSHSATHPDFGKLEPARLHDELAGSRQTFQQRIGIAPTTFAIPLGQSANWTEQAGAAARAAGYEIVYAQAEETRPPDTVARTFVTCFDHDRIFAALLAGVFDRWEEWV